jgi:hypothetical protein
MPNFVLSVYQRVKKRISFLPTLVTSNRSVNQSTSMLTINSEIRNVSFLDLNSI